MGVHGAENNKSCAAPLAAHRWLWLKFKFVVEWELRRALQKRSYGACMETLVIR